MSDSQLKSPRHVFLSKYVHIFLNCGGKFVKQVCHKTDALLKDVNFKVEIDRTRNQEILAVIVLNAAIILSIQKDQVRPQVLQQVFCQFVVLQFEDLLLLIILAVLIIIVIHKHFDTQVVVFVLSEGKAIVCNQEPISASSVAIQ